MLIDMSTRSGNKLLKKTVKHNQHLYALYLVIRFFGKIKQTPKKWSLQLLIILPGFISMFSQETEITENFIHYTNKDGLSNPIIRSIKQDKYGFMWFATEDGVDKFDGYEFKTYRFDNKNPNSLPDNFIYTLYPTKDGGMLVGTNVGGFARYNVATDNFKVYRTNPHNTNALSNNKVLAIMEDHKGNYWVGTDGGGLNFYDMKTDSFTVYQHNLNNPNSILNDNVSGVLEDNIGNIWVRTFAGLSKLDPKTGTFTNYVLPGTTENDRMNENMILDNAGIIWMGWNFQLVKFNTGTSELEFAPFKATDRPLSEILSVCNHDKDHLWISTTHGIHLYNKNNFNVQSFYADSKNPRALQNDYSNAVFIDRSGVLWCSGLSKLSLNTKKFKNYRFKIVDPESRGGGRIRAILVDSQGKYWVSLVNGIAVIDPKTNTTHYILVNSNDPSKPFNSSPTCFMEDKDLNIWIGQWGTGITIFKNGDLKNFKKIIPQSGIKGDLQDGIIQTLYRDSYGNIWFGTGLGLDLYNPKSKKFRHFGYDPSDSNSITQFGVQSNCILEDVYGNIWVGTWGGLTKMTILNPEKGSFYSKYKFKRYRNNPDDPSSISDSRIISMLYDKEKYPNKIFTGTCGGGMNVIHFNNETGIDSISTYTTKDGLSNNVVYGILSDAEGFIWMSTNDGLSKLNLKTNEFRRYNVDDGLQDNAFYWGACTKGKNNELFFGGINGMNKFNPEEIQNDPIPPEIVFTDFKVLNKTVLPGQKVNNHIILDKPINNTDSIILSYKENVFSFKFAALHYAYPMDNKYKYKMEGFDKEWVETDANSRTATYTNLDPGNYIFKVNAANYDGIWNNEGVKIVIIITPPFWKTWWFKLITIAIIIFLLLLTYYLRVRQIRIRNRLLKDLVEKRTKELHEKNLILQQQTNNLNESNVILEERQQQIEEQAEELTAQRDDLNEVNAVKDKLFSIIAHDLKNPFNTLMGFIELLQMRYDHYADEKRKEMLSYAKNSADDIYNLLVNLLNWSRAQRGAIELNPELTNLVNLINENLSLVKNQAANKNLEIQFSAVPKEVTLYLDADLINAVLRNLLTNAIKYSHTNGKVELSCSVGDNSVIVSIKDSGIGISEEDMKKLFRNDIHYSTSGTKNEKGTGLGLITCKEFIEKHYGKIWMESELGKGSTFYFSLPITVNSHQ